MLHKTQAVLIAILLISCGKIDIKDRTLIRKFTIKKGSHHARGFRFETLSSNQLNFEFKFDDSAFYDLGNENQGDTNKLLGFSGCNSHHHDNSYRLGWRPSQSSIEIRKYIYNESVVSYETIKTVEPNKWYPGSFELLKDSCVITVDGISIKTPRTDHCEAGAYYMLFPYFGGNEPAPHDITIYIRQQIKR